MCLSADYADPSTREGHLTRLVHHLRNQLNTALANELWEDASETNVTIQTVLESAGWVVPRVCRESQRIRMKFQRQFSWMICWQMCQPMVRVCICMPGTAKNPNIFFLVQYGRKRSKKEQPQMSTHSKRSRGHKVDEHKEKSEQQSKSSLRLLRRSARDF